LLATEGVVVRRDHPKLIGAIDWLVRNGGLRPVLPGVYAQAESCDSIGDRWRQNLLILDGWCVLRFTWTMIEEQPEKVIAMVREAIEMLTGSQS
jgi:hypothetical protein